MINLGFSQEVWTFLASLYNDVMTLDWDFQNHRIIPSKSKLWNWFEEDDDNIFTVLWALFLLHLLMARCLKFPIFYLLYNVTQNEQNPPNHSHFHVLIRTIKASLVFVAPTECWKQHSFFYHQTDLCPLLFDLWTFFMRRRCKTVGRVDQAGIWTLRGCIWMS